MSDADVDHMLCRYLRRAQFLRTGLAAAAHGDHEAAEVGLLVLTDDTLDCIPGPRRRTRVSGHARADSLCHCALRRRPVRAVGPAVGAGDRRHRRCGRRQRVRRLSARPRRHGYGRFCVETGRLAEAEPWLQRAGARARAAGWKLATARTQLERATARWAAGDRARVNAWSTKRIRRSPRAVVPTTCREAGCTSASVALSIEKLDDSRRAFRSMPTALAGGKQTAAHPPYSVAAQLGRHLPRRFRCRHEW